MQDNPNQAETQESQGTPEPKKEKAPKVEKDSKKTEKVKLEKAKAETKATPTQKQFEIELERVQFSDRGKKLSKPNKQFMNVNSFIHFLKNAKVMGWTLKVLTVAAELNESQIKALNAAVKEWNEAQPTDPETKQKENQLSNF